MAEAVNTTTTVEAADPSPGDEARVRKNRTIGLSVAAAIFLFDQASKWVVINLLQLEQQRVIEIVSFFDLRWVQNFGVSMSLLTASSDFGRWMLVALTAAIATFVAVWMWREKRRDDSLALAFVLGGALGNILDRARLGYVVDFADLHFGEWRPFLVFNVADAAITIGVLLLLARALLTRDGKASRKDK